jgi:hypothetical protein
VRPARGPAEPASPASGLDLNRATPRELARLAGISWSLAARIVAARDGVGLDTPRAGAPAEATGRRRVERGRRWEPDTPPRSLEPAPASATQDPEPVDGAPGTPSE